MSDLDTDSIQRTLEKINNNISLTKGDKKTLEALSNVLKATDGGFKKLEQILKDPKNANNKDLAAQMAQEMVKASRSGKFSGGTGFQQNNPFHTVDPADAKNLKEFGSSASYSTNHLKNFAHGLIDTGGSLKGLTTSVLGLAEGFLSVKLLTAAVINPIERNVDLYRSLASVGEIFSNDMFDMAGTIEKAGFSAEEYSKLITESGNIAGRQLGKSFIDIAGTVKRASANFVGLGMTTDQTNQALVDYLEIQRTTGMLDTINNQNITGKVRNFIEQTTQMAAALGVSRDQIMKQQIDLAKNYDFQNELRDVPANLRNILSGYVADLKTAGVNEAAIDALIARFTRGGLAYTQAGREQQATTGSTSNAVAQVVATMKAQNRSDAEIIQQMVLTTSKGLGKIYDQTPSLLATNEISPLMANLGQAAFALRQYQESLEKNTGTQTIANARTPEAKTELALGQQLRESLIAAGLENFTNHIAEATFMETKTIADAVVNIENWLNTSGLSKAANFVKENPATSVAALGATAVGIMGGAKLLANTAGKAIGLIPSVVRTSVGGITSVAKGVGTAAKFGGKLLGAAGAIGVGAYEAYSDKQQANADLAAGRITKEQYLARVGEAYGGGAGTAGGAIGGAAAGALVGSVVPLVGTAIGGIIGGIAGAYYGHQGGQYIGGKISGGDMSETTNTPLGPPIPDELYATPKSAALANNPYAPKLPESMQIDNPQEKTTETFNQMIDYLKQQSDNTKKQVEILNNTMDLGKQQYAMINTLLSKIDKNTSDTSRGVKLQPGMVQ